MAELVFALTLLSPFVSAFASVGDRVIPLESWGKRARHDFTAENVRFVKSAGFTGVFVNGGSGFGADQMPMELAAESEVLPRLAPLTVRANKEELSARAGLLAENGMDTWWCLWGVIGPDESDRSAPSGESNRDRFGAAAGKFRRLADVLAAAGNPRSAVARAEGYGIALAGELYGSIARTVAAGRAYAEGDVQRLRRLIAEELDARTREVELSEKLPPECGVNVPLVEEDMQNMRLYLSLDSFPSAPPGIFDFTPSPYSN